MIGEQIGRWTVVKKLSRGGMADVYLAEESSPSDGDSGKVAIKILRLEGDPGDHAYDRFQREIEILRSLKHDNIVRLLESGVYAGLPFLVMEYVDGLSLDQVLEQRGKLRWEEVVSIGQMIAAALRYAHRQEVIHRDLKPANVLATWDHVVKLTDFGIARLLRDGKITRDRTVVGTASYLSPEQATGKPASRKSDLYSLGVVLYELLTGRLPFEAGSDAELLHKHRYARFEVPSRLVEKIPAELDQLIISLLEKDPDKRPPNALAVEDSLLKLKRKFDRKKQYTPSPQSQITKLMVQDEEDTPHATTTQHGRAPFPIIRAGVILISLAGLLGLYFWIRQPASAESVQAQIDNLLQVGDWNAAETKFEELNGSHGSSIQPDRLQELQDRINAVKNYHQGKALSGPYTFIPPRSEAERFYRRGVLAYYEGRVVEARAIWQHLVKAFVDVSTEGAWVRLAEEALKQQDTPQATRLNETLQHLAAKETPEARPRLQALRQLYAALPASSFKDQALEQIDKALQGLR